MERQQEQIRRSPLSTAGKAGSKVGKSEKRLKRRRAPKAPRGLAAQVRKLQAQFEHLQAQVEQVQERLAARPRPAFMDDDASPVLLELQSDEYERWIAEHRDELAKYPDCFVAIDLERGRQGVVLHSADEARFADELVEFQTKDPATSDRLIITHTSMYVSNGANEGGGQ